MNIKLLIIFSFYIYILSGCDSCDSSPKNFNNYSVTEILKLLNDYKIDDFKILDYDPHPSIKMPISV